MITRVLIIGGYGNFGRFISETLAQEPSIQLIIAGRSIEKANTLALELEAVHLPETITLDIHQNLTKVLTAIKPHIVIHTSGPFQTQSYDVATSCIDHGCHYIDLADGREFVNGISQLDQHARGKGVLVVSGASSVPCFTAALVDEYINHFKQLDKLDYGITTAQKTTRGVATTAAILGYTGKPFDTLINGTITPVYGWQSLHARHYPGLGKRWLANCDIPDLTLFPRRYPSLKTLRFYAGLEIPAVHIALWALSWGVRIGLIPSLEKTAPILLKVSFLLDKFGTRNSGFHMIMTGTGLDDKPKTINFDLIARQGDGPFIPCIPSILLTKRLASGEIKKRGAMPCLDLIRLNDYLDALKKFAITWTVNTTGDGLTTSL